jgi:hypothetical protein
MSEIVRTLGSWVRISLEACVYVRDLQQLFLLIQIQTEFSFRENIYLGILLVVVNTAEKCLKTGSMAPYPMGAGALSPEVKRPGREADHSPPSTGESKNTSSWHGAQLSMVYVFMERYLFKPRDNFTIIFTDFRYVILVCHYTIFYVSNGSSVIAIKPKAKCRV